MSSEIFRKFPTKIPISQSLLIKLQALDVGLQLDYKETPTQEFFCDNSEIFKNTVSYRIPRMGASTADLQRLKGFTKVTAKHL